MLKIRFVRIGKKNKPFFRIAVGDSRRTPKGKFIEKLGYYNPLKKEKSINKERVLYWLSNGAQCSDTVHNLLVSLEIIKGPKRKIKIKAKKSADAPTSTKATEDKKSANVSAKTVKDEQEEKSEVKKPARNASHSDAGGEKAEVKTEEVKEEVKEDKKEPKEKEENK